MQNIAIFILNFEEIRKMKKIFERENHMFYFSKECLHTSIEPPYVYEYLKPIENGIE
jgi:hypothetical protein